MVDRSTRLRWRRVFRRKQKQVGELGVQAEQNVERLVIRRLGRLLDVRRFVGGWLVLVTLLIIALVGQFRALNRTWQSLQPVDGGIYAEGLVGTFTNANPLYATSLADTTVSRLVFSGLLKYDDQNKLTPDLAESWTVSADNLHYVVKLRPDVRWHDGEPVTADDVVYTFQTAQNPDAKSSLGRSWQGVKVSAKDAQTVEFTLKTAFAPFPHSLVTGIVPKHVLAEIPMSELRSAAFNTTRPVGSGPFSWSSVEVTNTGYRDREQRVGLLAYKDYHRGAPKLDSFVIRTYQNPEQMLKDFRQKKITAIVGLDEVPPELREDSDLLTYEPVLTAQVMAFFKTDSKLLNDKTVRQSLVRSVRVSDVVHDLENPAPVTDGPILRGEFAYDPGITQLSYDKSAAETALNKAGWKVGPQGTRVKNGTPLQLRLIAQDGQRPSELAEKLRASWRDVGVDVTVALLSEAEMRTAIRDRNYDILLYGISVGADPDVFAYWHSTQLDPRSGLRLNFSDYSSKTADSALEAGRSRSDPSLRAVKYQPFLSTWRQDAPALALYQPKYVYITNSPLFGFNAERINTASDRFGSVHEWRIQQALQPKP